MLPPKLESTINEFIAGFSCDVRSDGSGEVYPDLLSMEALALEFTREMGRRMLQTFVDERERQARGRRGRCRCGLRRPVHRRSKWSRKTLLGEVTVGDPFMYCRGCSTGERPVHSWLGTPRETWSLIVQEAAVDLVTDESAGAAVDKLERHHPGVKMDRTAALRMMHQHGAAARAFIDAKLADGCKLAELPDADRGEGAAALEVEFDGGMVPVATLQAIPLAPGKAPELTAVRGLLKRKRDCRWEEVKAGLVQTPGEVDRLYSLRPTGKLDAAFDDLFALACLKGWTETTQVRGIADGALHIRPRMEEAFDAGDFRFILDRPHAKEHLSDAGAALQTTTQIPAQDWARSALSKLETGHAMDVVDELRDAHTRGADDENSDLLRREANYFERNADAVVYATYRANGWSTASSEIESAHRFAVQCRLKISGAWWHPDHIDDILALRMLRVNGWWNEYWKQANSNWTTNARSLAKARESPDESQPPAA